MSGQATFCRRTVLSGLGSTPLLSPGVAQAATSSLRALAASKGILFGAAVGAGAPGTLTGSLSDENYCQLLRTECAGIVAENEMKAYVISDNSEERDYGPADRIAAFAKKEGLKLRGHTLFWNNNNYLPRWLVGSSFASARDAEGYLRRYIKEVCEHFSDRVYSWDVVNETIDPESGELRGTPFDRVLGEESIRIAFESAKISAPHAQLVYNDYVSWGRGSARHRKGVLVLLERLRSTNVPIDALGLQSHIGNEGEIDKVQMLEWRCFIDEVVAMGYKVLVTELDINDRALPADLGKRDAGVASLGGDYLDLMLSYRAVEQVFCWGLVDKYNWMQKWSPRDDGLAQRPAPFDDNYKPKAFYRALQDAFVAAPGR